MMKYTFMLLSLFLLHAVALPALIKRGTILHPSGAADLKECNRLKVLDTDTALADTTTFDADEAPVWQYTNPAPKL